MKKKKKIMNNHRIEKSILSWQKFFRLGALFTLCMIHYTAVGQPLHKKTSGHAFITNNELIAIDTLEYKGHKFEFWQIVRFYPKWTEESNEEKTFFYFMGDTPEKWKGFTGYEREYAVLSGYMNSLDGFLTEQAGFPHKDTIPMQGGKFNHKETFRLCKEAPGEDEPIYVTKEVNVDLKEMKKNKVEVTFSTKKSLEKKACYDMLERRYYKGPKKGKW